MEGRVFVEDLWPQARSRSCSLLPVHPRSDRLRWTCRPQRLDDVGDGLGKQS
jgi:hypothetical protein